jgi:hypothetical protein
MHHRFHLINDRAELRVQLEMRNAFVRLSRIEREDCEGYNEVVYLEI